MASQNSLRPRAEALTDDSPGVWAEMLPHLSEAAGTYWLSVPRDGGAVHTRPLLAVWVGGQPYFACGDGTGKARLLADSPRVSLAVTTGSLDVVVEGRVARVQDENLVEEVAGVYPAVYGWAPVTEGGLITGPAGAPTAGPPPYAVYGITPEVVYAFPADDVGHGPTRWRFDTQA
ncbi:pyridoxamine 5'-phosphate oxidase family protein [Nocardiopsis exhalans]|uniref:Pyridoxamine 5'-phosphate oxidase family protein n=1 Tax=Nocardiopsis exhalans TaxID=163604 RepID=A0ABY5CZM6_9ACTN|nr:pyridoxamine 5'-phosphate oxidase family protein [Nocardiopsis exhalans]USY17309.1 pyridoxamine 5'-phosphate oxidase family protein [Nocardiopsis exhalans]